MQGLEFHSGDDTSATIAECFAQKLVVESCGAHDQVLKIMPALTIEPEVLRDGLGIVAKACHRLFADTRADAEVGAEVTSV
jgi:diaminobutyrate-2-oxoglutarate transaminase